MQFDYIRRKFVTLLGSAAAALLEIAFAIAVQGIVLLSMIAVIVALITVDLVALQHAFSPSGGRWEQALVLTINAMAVVILVWLLRQYGKLRHAEPSHPTDYRQQREIPATLSEDDEWWTVLEVSPDASANEIRRSYRRKIRLYHPDRVAGLAPAVRESAERRSKRLNAAYAEAMRERRTRS